ncbi:pyridoxal phosphate-dependent aminotransferase [Prodigiosinella confusarubida]|uniref:Aminotransferase n=1 Tax=Serratia sp. (strain ATCC 39006) TaxID=104623 RepID=A0A2I5T8Y9_SERS3|nr:MULTISPECIES: pyridoxal phosphate-dependent aminotransferase [Enterobacterales]AUH01014.1 pyridoxal phosphate-dependent aminotransferase [Serratia sp. ATCC 39006]AUH05335.1 pyridoxal phosphate-dependent aminotransferase [Serratia sp. ATCC 39006]
MRCVADRVKRIGLSETYAILDKVKLMKAEGKVIYDLGGGEPDFATPEYIVNFTVSAMKNGITHYTASKGSPSLLKAIANQFFEENHLPVSWDKNIIVTPSAKHALFITLMTLLNPEDEIVIPSPCWVSYIAMAEMAGAKAVALPLKRENQFQLTRKALKSCITNKTRVLLLNNPNNPTGRILTEDEIQAVCQVAQEHDLFVVMDEIYEHIRYIPDPHRSIAAEPGMFERTVTISGFSKAWAMTGWRLGYLCAPEYLLNEMLKVQQHSVGCAGSFIQQGGLAALIGDRQPMLDMVTEYRKRRDFMVSCLNMIDGIECRAPEGGLYVYADISGLDMGDAQAFTHWLLTHAHVAVTPGTAFGKEESMAIRLSFAGAMETIVAAMDSITQSIAKYDVLREVS